MNIEVHCMYCKGDGFYYRVPRGMSPFSASIEATAKAMRRIQCNCPTGQQWVEGEPSECDGSAWDRLPPLVKAN